MKGKPLSLQQFGLRSWPAIAVAILIIQSAVSLVLTRPADRIASAAITSFSVLFLATVLAARNAIQSRQSIRLFWSFLALGCGLWALNPGLWAYHLIGWTKNYPDFWLSTSSLFLHVVLLLAAVASRPHLRPTNLKPYRSTLNFLLLLFFLVFIYAFFLVPYPSTQWNSPDIIRFGAWYFVENLVLLAVTATMAFHARQAWRSIYLQLLGSSSLYAVITLVLNIVVVGKNGPLGGLYEVLYIAVECWFVWIALLGQKLAIQLRETVRLDASEATKTFPLAMLAVIAIPAIGIWELLRGDELYVTRGIRLLIVLITFLLLAVFVFLREYLTGQELAADADSATDRLRLATESGKSVGWDWDVRSGRGSWFGDLQTMFGIPSNSYSGHVEDFRRRVHPDDRARVWKAVDDARKTHGQHAAEFRVVHQDGTEHWVTARGKFSYASNGDAVRMLGIATDITEAKRAERAVRESEDKLGLLLASTAEGIYGTDLNGRCTFCNPACLTLLGYEHMEELLGKNMHAMIHHSHADGTPYPEEACRIRQACSTGEGIHIADEPLWKRDGTSIPAEYWSYPQRREGKVVGAVVAFIDITDRKQAEQALRQSEAFKSSILSSLENQIAVLNKQGIVIEVNEVWTRRAQENGMTTERVSVGADYLAALRRSAAERPEARDVLACIQPVMQGTVRRCRYDYKCGWLMPSRWFTVTATTLHTAEGGVVIAYKDISDVRSKDAALAETQRLANVGSWQWEPETDTVTWSEELYRIAGISPLLPAVSFHDHPRLYTPESWQLLHNSVEKAMRTGESYELDLEMVRADGTTRWLIARGEAERDPSGRVVRLRGTVQDISERKRAEQALRESEERFRLVSNTAPVMIWMSGPDKRITFFNKTWLNFTGRGMKAELKNGLASGIYPEDVQRFLDSYARAFDRREDFRMEYRARRHDGQYRWLMDCGVPRFNHDGFFAGYIGSRIDVTERKEAEEALSTLGRRLIAAHEEERTWIARELHDDISQRMALLSIELEGLRFAVLSGTPELTKRINQVLQQTAAIGNDINAISHRLHSSKVEYLGLVVAAKAFCTEFAGQQKIKIDLAHADIPQHLSSEVEVCLFRVLQESLRNAAKHSGVGQVEVDLRADENDLHLTVRDLGIGFDPDAALHQNGLGLVSMRERLRLIDGKFAVHSSPNRGTTVHASVPLRR
jgi:PAS domain S-box-containing protein